MQEAQGKPVDHRDDDSGDDSGNDFGSQTRDRSFLAAPRLWLLFAAVASTLIAVDQVTKMLAERKLADGQSVEVIGDLLQLHLTYNPGAAFSLGTRFTVVIAVLACTATLVVLWLSRGVANRIWAVGLGFLLAGIDGNLIDRIFREPSAFRGHVVDFLMLPNWPVFNVADICINVGVGLILIQILRGIGLDGQRIEQPDEQPADDQEDDQ